MLNQQGAELNLSGGTITGFNAAGSQNSGGASYYPSGGGGVYNSGTFTMTGGTITGNTSIYKQSEEHIANQDNSGGSGGGVYNGGVFYMKGGTISDNTANIGGGVYNDASRSYFGGGTSGHNYQEDIAAGEFYMTGGEIAGGVLEGYWRGEREIAAFDRLEIEGELWEVRDIRRFPNHRQVLLQKVK